MDANPSSYDLVAYPSYTHPQTHPSRLAVIGSLFGLEPAHADGCRVLELGCSNGSNLVPMADGFPESEFVGIDLACRPIAYGQQMIREIGLKNVRLVQGSLAEIGPGWGKFDYIIAHGLFSWVPASVRDEVLRLCRNCLNPQGIAFISFNALPGCHLRKMLREMMLFHTRGFDSATERVQQAKALARFLAESQNTRDEYRLWMKAELESVLGHDEGHLYHDELAEISEPFYFTQFIEQAGAHGLQYVGEADYFEMFDHGFSDATRQSLNQLGHNRILREQYLDFLKCRRFRQTLLCHREAALKAEPMVEKVAAFLISSMAKCAGEKVDFSPGVSLIFETPKGARCTTDFALGKAALSVLEKNSPLPLAFVELLRQATQRLTEAGIQSESNGEPEKKLSAFLLEIYGAGLVEFRTSLPRIARSVGERPVASAVTRWQAQHSDYVTSRFHIAVKVEDEVGRLLLSALDGTVDRSAMLEKIWQLLKAKNALVLQDEGEAATRRKIGLELENNLLKLVQMGLLVD